MNKKKDNKRGKRENLRFVILQDSTLKEKFSRSISVGNLYIILFLIFFGILTLSFAIVSFTPIKHLVPGYANIENNSYVIKLNKYVNELEEKIAIQEEYKKSIRKILIENNAFENTNGEVESESGSGVKNAKNIAYKSYGNYDFSNPLSGAINKDIDIETGHYGIDIAGSKDAVIKSTMDGTVIFSDWSIETGYTIIIQHQNGFLSTYKHNSKLFKEIGDFVKKGEAIGTIGSTGTLSSGPHLHFELWFDGIPKNPMEYINLD